MPTEDEIQAITEARKNDPDIPLGTAEEFLYALSNVPQLVSRLRLWRFMYSFQVFEEVILPHYVFSNLPCIYSITHPYKHVHMQAYTCTHMHRRTDTHTHQMHKFMMHRF